MQKNFHRLIHFLTECYFEIGRGVVNSPRATNYSAHLFLTLLSAFVLVATQIPFVNYTLYFLFLAFVFLSYRRKLLLACITKLLNFCGLRTLEDHLSDSYEVSLQVQRFSGTLTIYTATVLEFRLSVISSSINDAHDRIKDAVEREILERYSEARYIPKLKPSSLKTTSCY